MNNKDISLLSIYYNQLKQIGNDWTRYVKELNLVIYQDWDEEVGFYVFVLPLEIYDQYFDSIRILYKNFTKAFTEDPTYPIICDTNNYPDPKSIEKLDLNLLYNAYCSLEYINADKNNNEYYLLKYNKKDNIYKTEKPVINSDSRMSHCEWLQPC